MADGIRSKEKVQQFGEVFTPDSIVNDMLDLVDESVMKDCKTVDDYINLSYLEPACGDGQFLIRILYRKLENVNKLPLEDRPLAIIKSLSKIYGVDIQNDNVEKAKQRMYDIVCGKPVETFDINGRYNIQIDTGVDISGKFAELVKYVIDSNIVEGNTLQPEELFIKDWQFNGENVTIQEFSLQDLNSPVHDVGTMHYTEITSGVIETATNDVLESYDF